MLGRLLRRLSRIFRDPLQTEYEIVESKWRFLQGFRYAVFAFLATTHAGLLAVYRATVPALEELSRAERIEWAMLLFLPAFMPILALLILLAAYLFAQRLRELYTTCSQRGAKLEDLLEILKGIFTLLEEKKKPKISHNDVFEWTFIVLGVAWGILMGWVLYLAIVSW